MQKFHGRNHLWLVVEPPTHLKKKRRIVSWGDEIPFSVYGKKNKFPWFQTTKQIYIPIIL